MYDGRPITPQGTNLRGLLFLILVGLVGATVGAAIALDWIALRFALWTVVPVALVYAWWRRHDRRTRQTDVLVYGEPQDRRWSLEDRLEVAGWGAYALLGFFGEVIEEEAASWLGAASESTGAEGWAGAGLGAVVALVLSGPAVAAWWRRRQGDAEPAGPTGPTEG
ncbi:MAG: hypothetical protein ACLF0P_13450 [Thermoanaerobaculia bacterium]